MTLLQVPEFTIKPSPHYSPDYCNIFWGSHGCSKMAGHVEAGDLIHQCGPDEEDDTDEFCNQFIVLTLETDDENYSTGGGAVGYCNGDNDWTTWFVSRWFT